MTTIDLPLEGTPVDLPVIDDAGNIVIEALRNDPVQLWTAADSAAFDQYTAAWRNYLQADFPPQVDAAFEAAISPIQTSIDDGVITPAQGNAFLRWLNYNKGVTSIPNDGNVTSSMQSYLSAWIIEQSGLSPKPVTTPPPPAPAPITPVEPAPTLAPNPPAPAPLPSPSHGQTTTVAASAGITSSTVTGTLSEGTSAPQVSAALAVTAVNTLQVVAKVVDQMLPGMAPGQVPEALAQLNQAAHVLENQLAILRATTTGHAKGSLSSQITTLQGLVRAIDAEISTLQDQMAEKADSALEDGLSATQIEIDTLGLAVGTITGTTIPALANRLGTAEQEVAAVSDTVTNKVQPELNGVKNQADTLTTELSGTDKECLDKLCDAEGNVTDPIQEGGATPSLLKGLGNLLSKGFELGALIALADGIFSIFDAKAAVQGVVSDTEVIAAWATSAASYIESSQEWRGPL